MDYFYPFLSPFLLFKYHGSEKGKNTTLGEETDMRWINPLGHQPMVYYVQKTIHRVLYSFISMQWNMYMNT